MNFLLSEKSKKIKEDLSKHLNNENDTFKKKYFSKNN
jgi:hypothetical protein